MNGFSRRFVPFMLRSMLGFCRISMFRKRRGLKLVLWVVLIGLVPFLYIELTFPVRYIFRHKDPRTSCIIPNLNPFDPSLKQFIWDPAPLICDTKPVVLYSSDSGIIELNRTAVSELGLSEHQVFCTYRTIHREDDDITITFSEPQLLKPPSRVNSDFVHAICSTEDGLEIFNKILTTVITEEIQRGSPLRDETPNTLSVLMFGIDSVSRSASIRKLPKTIRYLTEELKSFDFKGYMKVSMLY